MLGDGWRKSGSDLVGPFETSDSGIGLEGPWPSVCVRVISFATVGLGWLKNSAARCNIFSPFSTATSHVHFNVILNGEIIHNRRRTSIKDPRSFKYSSLACILELTSAKDTDHASSYKTALNGSLFSQSTLVCDSSDTTT